jgi:hypothetical protein
VLKQQASNVHLGDDEQRHQDLQALRRIDDDNAYDGLPLVHRSFVREREREREKERKKRKREGGREGGGQKKRERDRVKKRERVVGFCVFTRQKRTKKID